MIRAITQGPHYYESRRPLLRLGTFGFAELPLGRFPYRRHEGPDVPCLSLCNPFAPFIPATTEPLNRDPLRLSPGSIQDPGLDDVSILSTPRHGFTDVQLPCTRLTPSCRVFPVRSRPGLFDPSR